MELLNNLWIAISTPNEELINIIAIPLLFAEIYLMLSLSTSILNVSSSRKEKIVYILIISFVTLIVY